MGSSPSLHGPVVTFPCLFWSSGFRTIDILDFVEKIRHAKNHVNWILFTVFS